MPVWSAFLKRTLPLAGSLSFRDWAGFYAATAYEAHHEHEYNAVRNGCALIDISPLFKYVRRGPAAGRLVDRLITRDASKLSVGQVYYTPWWRCRPPGPPRRWAAWDRCSTSSTVV